MIAARFGNDAPLMQVTDRDADGRVTGTRAVPAPHLNQSVTTVEFADYIDDAEFVDLTLSTSNDRVLAMIARSLPKDLRHWAVAVNEAEQIMGAHSTVAPAWVAADDSDLEAALAAHFDCPRGEPTALLTNAGRDALHAQHLSTGAQPATFSYLALASSATATAPAAGDTTLAGEITTAGGGLIRGVATYAHTAGTNTSTLTRTFTANATDALPVTVSQAGIFNAATGGTLGYKTALNASATLTVAGDNVAVTSTINAG